MKAVRNLGAVRVAALATLALVASQSMMSRAVNAPTTPVRLRAAAASASQIFLTWTDTSADEAGFKVERADAASGPWIEIATTSTNASFYMDPSLAPRATFFYRVRAYNQVGNSGYSDTARGRTRPAPRDVLPPTAPAQLTATTGTECDQVNLRWTASTDNGRSGLLGYNVYGPSGLVKLVRAPTTSTSIPELAPSTLFSFAVTAIDNAGNESALSPAASAATRADCSGIGGAYRWSSVYGGSSSAGSSGVALGVDRLANIIVAVDHRGTIDYGGGALTSLGSSDVAAAKFTAGGLLLWSKIYGGDSDQVPTAIAIDGTGDVYVVGHFDGTLDLDAEKLRSDGPNPDIFLAKLSGESGKLIWSKRFGGSGYDKGYAVATDADSNVVISGYFTGTVNFGGGEIAADGADMFLAKYKSDGSFVWAKALGGPGADTGRSVAIDPSGAILVTGTFELTADFGGGPIVSAGARDIVVAKYAGRDGAHVWSRGFGGYDDDFGFGVAADPIGNVAVTGLFTGTIDFGGGALAAATPSYPEIFAVELGADGGHRWSRGCGGGIPWGGYAVTTDIGGSVFLSATAVTPVNFGGGALGSTAQDIVVSKLDVNGTHLWSRRIGLTSGSRFVRGIVADPSGEAVFTGELEGSADFGGGSISGSGPFLAKTGK